MRRSVLARLGGLVLLSCAIEASAQLEVVQGKQSVLANTYVFDLEPPGGPAVMSVELAKAKKKRALMIDLTMVSNDEGPVTISAGVIVNNNPALALRPNSAVVGNCSTGEFACTVSGHWWLDLDAAEEAFPGTVLNEPITIDVYANETNGVGAAEVSVRAWLLKK